MVARHALPWVQATARGLICNKSGYRHSCPHRAPVDVLLLRTLRVYACKYDLEN